MLHAEILGMIVNLYRISRAWVRSFIGYDHKTELLVRISRSSHFLFHSLLQKHNIYKSGVSVDQFT
jgi:hypothetical protein